MIRIKFSNFSSIFLAGFLASIFLNPPAFAENCTSDTSSCTVLGGFRLYAQQSLRIGNSTFAMQADGNLVLYGQGGQVLWAASNFQVMDLAPFTGPTGGLSCVMCYADFQTDGNLVLYNPLFYGNSYHAYWSSNTFGNVGATLAISQDFPNLRILLSNGLGYLLSTSDQIFSQFPLLVYPAGSASGFKVGSVAGRGRSVLSTSPSDFLTFGPYVKNLINGVYRAKFKLMVDNNSADDRVIGALDVRDNISGVILARREFHRKEFESPFVPQDFELTFATHGENELEFRVYYYGYSYLEHQQTTVSQLSAFVFSDTYNANSFEIKHNNLGQADGSAWAAASAEGSGFLTFGPYTKNYKAGNYKATFILAVDSNTADNFKVVTIDVHEAGASDRILAQLDITRKMFSAPLAAQNFELPFGYDGTDPLEFRVFVHGTSYVKHFSTVISQVSPLFYFGNDPALWHPEPVKGYGDGTAWVSEVSHGPGFLTAGPYVRSVPVGNSTATFSLLVDNNSANNVLVARIEAFDSDHNQVLAQRLIRRKNFKKEWVSQDFDLTFELKSPAALEFRIFTYGTSYLKHLSTKITPDRLTLTSLWNSQSHFEFRKRDDLSFQGLVDKNTASLVALDGTWYAFNRQWIEGPAGCTIGTLRTVVRSSADRGQTWSDPVVVASPTLHPNEADGCIVTDGGAYYDDETDTWHLLSQCWGNVDPNKSNWNLCHYTRAGISPMGAFSADSHNPVVVGGQLWRTICSGSNKTCPTTMIDEGTPQIIEKRGGNFYVTFHGANYGPNGVTTGARGIAKTPDFVNWTATDADLPRDAMLSAVDANKWNVAWAGGSIGVGNAQILRSDGYNYVLAEAADNSLNCTKGQQWIFGLMRSPTYAPSGVWQNSNANPFIVNTIASDVGCGLQYQSLIRDRGEIFLYFGIYSPDNDFPNYLYQLVDGPSSGGMKVK